jgi:hypothetical protein
LIATQGRLFFSHRRCTLLLLVYVFSFRHHFLSLSPQKATHGPTTTFALSLLRRSLARSVCSDMPIGLSRSPLPATTALRIALNFSPQEAGAAAGRPTACSMAKGASRCRPHRPPRCHHDHAAALDPPPRGCARLIESHHEGGN